MAELKDRLISVDIAKGIAIISVLLLHPSVYGNFHTPAIAQSVVPSYVFLILLPLLLLGTFGGGFLIISGLLSAYNIYKRTERKLSFRAASLPILLNSFLLLIIAPIRTMLLARTHPNSLDPTKYEYSILSGFLETGNFVPPSIVQLMQVGILPVIGLCGFAMVFILWLLFRKNGKIKTKRNVIILVSMGFIISLAYEPITNIIWPYIGIIYDKGGIFMFLAYVIRLFFSHQLSFFPMIAFAFFGMAFGILLAQKQKYTIIKKTALSIGITYFVGFVISLCIRLFTNKDGPLAAMFDMMDYVIFPKELCFLGLGTMILLIILFSKKIEFQSEENRLRIAKKTGFLRKFGTITLTIFMIEPLINGPLATLFHYLFNGGTLHPFFSTDPYMYNAIAIILFEITFITIWILFVFFWSKINFKYGFEHLFIVITDPFRKEKSKVIELYKKELSGILTWGINGYHIYRKIGILVKPKEVIQATKKYRDDSDIIKCFLDEKCTIRWNLKSSISEIFSSYEKWCGVSNEKALTKINFNKELEKRGFEKVSGAHNKLMWIGLKLVIN